MTSAGIEESPGTAVGRYGRPRFERGGPWVAVTSIRIAADAVIFPGEPLPESIKRGSLRRLFRMRRIGPAGHPWTESMIAARAARDAESGGSQRAPEPEPAGVAKLVAEVWPSIADGFASVE